MAEKYSFELSLVGLKRRDFFRRCQCEPVVRNWDAEYIRTSDSLICDRVICANGDA